MKPQLFCIDWVGTYGKQHTRRFNYSCRVIKIQQTMRVDKTVMGIGEFAYIIRGIERKGFPQRLYKKT
jgi:hypothetical protein